MKGSVSVNVFWFLQTRSFADGWFTVLAPCLGAETLLRSMKCAVVPTECLAVFMSDESNLTKLTEIKHVKKFLNFNAMFTVHLVLFF